MSSSAPAAPCSDALLWLAALAVGGAIACTTPVPAATGSTATPPASTAPAASPAAAPATGSEPATGTAAETPAAPVKASPYAAAKDEDGPAALPVKALEGTRAPGSQKSSPYAAAKDEVSSRDEGLPGNDRFWALLIPIGAASAIYGLIRQQESGGT